MAESVCGDFHVAVDDECFINADDESKCDSRSDDEFCQNNHLFELVFYFQDDI